MFSERECKKVGQNAFETNEKKKKARSKNRDKRKSTDGMDGSDPKEKMFKEH